MGDYAIKVKAAPIRIKSDAAPTRIVASGAQGPAGSSNTDNVSQGVPQKMILWGSSGNEIIRVVPTTFTPDADHTARVVQIETAVGRNLSGVEFHALHDFILAEKAANRWALHKRIYLPIWGSAAANAIDLVTGAVGTWVNNNNMEHGAGFVRSFGASNVAGHFNTGASPSTLGMSDAAGFMVSLLLKTTSAQTFAFPFDAVNTGSSECGFIFDGTSMKAVGNPYVDAGAIPRTGLFVNGRHSGTAYFKRRTTASGILTTTASTSGFTYTPSTSPFIVTGLSNNGSFNEYSITSEVGGYTFSLGMSQGDADAFIENYKTLWETCTGLTLP